MDVSVPAEDENEAMREAEERFLEDNAINPETQMGYTIEEDGSFYPQDGPYGRSVCIETIL